MIIASLSYLLSRLFSSSHERQAQEIIDAHNAEALEIVKRKATVLLDQVTATHLYQNCELFSTLQALTDCALELRQSIVIEGKVRTIWVNYDRKSHRASINFRV